MSRRKSIFGSYTSFTPNSIAGLSLWLDATDLTTITKDGSDYVSEWRDKSSNAYSFTQLTASAQPKYFADGFGTNNKPRFYFDGGDWIREVSSSVIDLTTDFTIFAVSQSSATSRQQIYCTVSSVSGILLEYNNSTRFLQYIAGTYVYSTPIGYVLSDNMLNTSRLKRSINSLDRYINSVFISNNTIVTGTTHNANLTIGASGTGAFRMIGNITEIIYYNTYLSDEEITTVQNYLNSKYGIY